MNAVTRLSRPILLAALLPPLALGAGETAASGGHRAFIACPVVQDTATVPCWLASDGKIVYYLGIQVDISAPFHPPQLKHKVLVEGTISHEPRICGAVVLKPVIISVLPELDRTCDTVLRKTSFTVIDPPRGPGPSNRGRRTATDGTPAPGIGATPVEREVTDPTTVSVPFSFDGLYMNVHAFPGVIRAARLAQQFDASHVVVTGHRGMVLLTNGELLYEKKEIAEQRARKVAQALKELGVDPARTDIEWQPVAEQSALPGHGRRVDITVSSR
jgi:outer membrane protein OmpA-like peptidoglycan-associated protein